MTFFQEQHDSIIKMTVGPSSRCCGFAVVVVVVGGGGGMSSCVVVPGFGSLVVVAVKTLPSAIAL